MQNSRADLGGETLLPQALGSHIRGSHGMPFHQVLGEREGLRDILLHQVLEDVDGPACVLSRYPRQHLCAYCATMSPDIILKLWSRCRDGSYACWTTLDNNRNPRNEFSGATPAARMCTLQWSWLVFADCCTTAPSKSIPKCT